MAQASARWASSKWNRYRWVCLSQSVLPHVSAVDREVQHVSAVPPAATVLQKLASSTSARRQVPQAAVLGQHPVQVPDLVLQVFLVAPREVPAIR
ncbi:unnamed protein product [Rangifer tarandus platyrhynchus]|uniref:Uncharacterized protein n=1 Tax=Rangifer tarandus platyrhynchus TaxID=3082113 RepID=A0AC59Z4C7_RANTA